MGSPKIKGAAVREFLGWYAHRSSPEALRRAVARLPPALQTVFDPEAVAVGLLASSWYDSSTVHALIEAIFKEIPPEERQVSIREGARHAVRISARGIYRFVLERLTPEMYARNIQRLWNMLHDNGEREIVMTSKTSCRSVIRNWPGHHPVLCLATTETMAAVLETMGCFEVHGERVACVSDGERECVSELRWSK